MSTFDDDLAAATDAPPITDDVDILLNGKPYTLRFTQVDGLVWADAVDHSPFRPGVSVDMYYGYNLRAAVEWVAPKSGVLLDGDETVTLRVDDPSDPDSPKPPVNQWQQLLKRLSGHDYKKVCDTVWGLNERNPQIQLDAAKKARSGSPENSI